MSALLHPPSQGSPEAHRINPSAVTASHQIHSILEGGMCPSLWMCSSPSLPGNPRLHKVTLSLYRSSRAMNHLIRSSFVENCVCLATTCEAPLPLPVFHHFPCLLLGPRSSRDCLNFLPALSCPPTHCAFSALPQDFNFGYRANQHVFVPYNINPIENIPLLGAASFSLPHFWPVSESALCLCGSWFYIMATITVLMQTQEFCQVEECGTEQGLFLSFPTSKAHISWAEWQLPLTQASSSFQ